MTLAAFHIGPVQFDQPVWLGLLPVSIVLILLIGRQTLSGMGTTSRRVAMVVRVIVVALLVGAIARPYWRKESKSVNVVVIRDTSDSVRRPWTPSATPGATAKTDLVQEANLFVRDAARVAKVDDLISIVTAARKSYVQVLPVPPREGQPDSEPSGDTDATNLAEAVTLAMAIMPGTAANRLLLISDGNQTAGDLMVAANAAKAAGVPIDVLPLKYKYDREVLVERIAVPATARMGQNVNLKVLLTALKPATGTLNLLINGETVDLDPKTEALGMKLALDAGMNAVPIPVALPRPGPQKFEAIFTPENPDDDAIVQNNRSMAVTFVQSEGRVLVITPSPDEVEPLLEVMQQSKIAAEVVDPDAAPKTKEEWAGYDAVIMANTPAFHFSQQQQEDLKAFVHDLGGGLVMVGGPDSFGAGGWIGSPLADALPIKLEPPQKRQMPRGALALIMHSCEMPQGNYWGKQVALAAVSRLTRQDLAGILEFSFGSGDTWVYPLSEVGNKSAITRAINSLTYGDMPSFDNITGMAVRKLKAADAGMKHIVIISDGDPQAPNAGLLQEARAAKISISTVLVYPHDRSANGPFVSAMQNVARQTGGRCHVIVDQGEFAKLPEIMIKEAQVVKRSLIWEGQPFQPTVVNAVSEPMRGLGGGVPQIGGYIVAADREGLSMVTLRGKENDPILAHWQYGLGKAVTFTSDVSARWARSWPSWGKFKAFWEQHVRWAMRPGGTADMRVLTEDLGDRTRVTVEALDQNGDRLNFVRFVGRVVGPNGDADTVELRQEGPGRYTGIVDTGKSGAYVMNFRYLTPDPNGGPAREGNLQAAVTRPFADEYRTLQDNAALLKLVAERTGGRVIGQDTSADPAKADLWSHKGLTMPVATRSIWITVSLIAIGLFLTDVAVRRVRFDPRAIAEAVRKGMGKGRHRAGEQMASLKQARERAQHRGAQAAPGATEAEKAAIRAAAKADKATAAAKFEVSADELSKARKNQAIPTLDPERAKVREAEAKTGEGKKEEEGGMSRLKKARERAQEKFEDDEKK
jgi:uncharacterized membrane protein